MKKSRVPDLTPKQRLFVHEYLVDLNATRAARDAGYSARTAEVQGCKLLRNAKVAVAIAKAQDKRAEKLEITADRVLQEIARLAFFDPAHVYNIAEGGALELKTFEEMGPWSRCISEIKEDRIIKEVQGEEDMVLSDKRTVKFHDKTSNLRTLCEHLGLLKNQQPAFPENVTFRFVYSDQGQPAGKKGKG